MTCGGPPPAAAAVSTPCKGGGARALTSATAAVAFIVPSAAAPVAERSAVSCAAAVAEYRKASPFWSRSTLTGEAGWVETVKRPILVAGVVELCVVIGALLLHAPAPMSLDKAVAAAGNMAVGEGEFTCSNACSIIAAEAAATTPTSTAW